MFGINPNPPEKEMHSPMHSCCHWRQHKGLCPAQYTTSSKGDSPACPSPMIIHLAACMRHLLLMPPPFELQIIGGLRVTYEIIKLRAGLYAAPKLEAPHPIGVCQQCARQSRPPKRRGNCAGCRRTARLLSCNSAVAGTCSHSIRIWRSHTWPLCVHAHYVILIVAATLGTPAASSAKIIQ